MERGNQDTVGEKHVLDDNDKLCFDTTTVKSITWKE